MKKIFCLFLALAVCFSLIGCGGNSHEGEVKTPSESSQLKGKSYEEVIDIFTEKGFTNIQTEALEDLIFGWLTKDGEVEAVSVGGDVDYSADKWVPADIEVVIRYHTFPLNDGETKETKSDEDTKETEASVVETEPSGETKEPVEEILTVENCPDLNTLLSLKDPFDSFVKEFATKYKGCTIEFDGNIAYLNNHGSYKTRYDILVYAGDHSETSAMGPSFQFVDVNIFDLNLADDTDDIGMGDNIHIVAKVGKYSENSGLFELDPISTQMR